MTMTIWKDVISLRGDGKQTVLVPKGTTFLSSAVQHGDICVWYTCDPQAPAEVHREVAVCCTGHVAPDPNEWDFLGTVGSKYDSLVFHVFVKPE